MTLDFLNDISDISMPLFALYLLIFCNFNKETLGCRLIQLLDNNMYVKHLMTFLLLFFLVVLIDPKNSDKNLLHNFGLSIMIYILFIITSRVSLPIMIIIVILLVVIYIISNIAKKKKEENKEDEYKRYKLAQNIIFIILMTLALFGIILYGIEKSEEYKGNFSFLTFIFGNPVCRNYTPKEISYVKIL